MMVLVMLPDKPMSRTKNPKTKFSLRDGGKKRRFFFCFSHPFFLASPHTPPFDFSFFSSFCLSVGLFLFFSFFVIGSFWFPTGVLDCVTEYLITIIRFLCSCCGKSFKKEFFLARGAEEKRMSAPEVYMLTTMMISWTPAWISSRSSRIFSSSPSPENRTCI